MSSLKSYPNRDRLVLPTTPRRTVRTKFARDNNNKGDTVNVFLRLAPITEYDNSTFVRLDSQHIKTLPPNGSASQTYSFTSVFDDDASQSDIFQKVARPITERFILDCKDGLIFTYGVSGSGKTHTMEGTVSDPGIIYRTFDLLFNSVGSQLSEKFKVESDGRNFYRATKQLYPDLNEPRMNPPKPSELKRWKNRTVESGSVEADPSAEYSVFISLVELYGKKQLNDLLDEAPSHKKDMRIQTDINGVAYVVNAMEVEVRSAQEAVLLYSRGIRRRKTSTTRLNDKSSRGHCVLNIKLVKVFKSSRDEILSACQLSLVDLAGCERTKRSGATGELIQEAGEINNSLGALRKCIRALRARDTTKLVQYREYYLTRLFQSYFEGRGTVCMVLCVKPTVEDFQENSIVLDFGVLTQDVAVDYAPPSKMLKRSGSRAQDYPNYAMMYESFQKKNPLPEIDPSLSDDMFFTRWMDRLKINRERRKKNIETILAVQNEVRQNILRVMTENNQLRQQYQIRAKDLRGREEQIERAVELLKSPETPGPQEDDWAPSAPKLVEATAIKTRSSYTQPKSTRLSAVNNPSTPETGDTHTPNTSSTNSSSDVIECPESSPRQSTGGVPVVNPRFNRSLSCPGGKWVHHTPPCTINTGTVLQPKSKNGRPVKNLQSKHILQKSAAGYSLVHQDAGPDGQVTTSVYKGDIIPTLGGGAQVILNDREIMEQLPPVRTRANSHL